MFDSFGAVDKALLAVVAAVLAVVKALLAFVKALLTFVLIVDKPEFVIVPFTVNELGIVTRPDPLIENVGHLTLLPIPNELDNPQTPLPMNHELPAFGAL